MNLDSRLLDCEPLEEDHARIIIYDNG
jgi:hypothetical protein